MSNGVLQTRPKAKRTAPSITRHSASRWASQRINNCQGGAVLEVSCATSVQMNATMSLSRRQARADALMDLQKLHANPTNGCTIADAESPTAKICEVRAGPCRAVPGCAVQGYLILSMAYVDRILLHSG